MKNLVILFLLILVFAACKKDRVCNCTITTDGSTTSRTQTAGLPPVLAATDTTVTQPLFTVNSLKKTYNKVKKSEIRSSCFEKSEESINRSSTNVVPGIYTITTTDVGTKKYSCKIE